MKKETAEALAEVMDVLYLKAKAGSDLEDKTAIARDLLLSEAKENQVSVRELRAIPAHALAVIWRRHSAGRNNVIAIRAISGNRWFLAGQSAIAHSQSELVMKYGEDFEVLS